MSMKYDFETILDRKGHDALALDAIGNPAHPDAPAAPEEGFDAIPMWVADMNFPIAPSVERAILERMQHKTYGYFNPSSAYYDAIINWQRDRNGVTDLRPEYIGHENGVLGGVISALRVLINPGDKVLLHSPTYVGFTYALADNGFAAVHSPLVKDAENVWRMDFQDMEEKLRTERIHAAIFCSPHNPCGRVWEQWEIEKAMELFRKYDVSVISDEIWSDVILPGYRHVPTQSVSEDAKMRTVALYAPSKTFNIAGLVGSYHVIYNDRIRDQVVKAGDSTRYNEMNVLSMHALIGGYSEEGKEWVGEMCEVIAKNAAYACDFIEKFLPGVTVCRPQGTYMLFVDFGEYLEKTGRTQEEVLRAGWEKGVSWQDGKAFFGPTAVRLNLALPFTRVKEAFGRMKKYIFI